MTPVQPTHAGSVGDVERLLPEVHGIPEPTRIALQTVGVDLGFAAETLAGLGLAGVTRPGRMSTG